MLVFVRRFRPGIVFQTGLKHQFRLPANRIAPPTACDSSEGLGGPSPRNTSEHTSQQSVT